MLEMPKRIEVLYKDALDNLLFIKQQQWRVTNYTLSAYAALVTAANLIKVRAPERVLFSFTALAVCTYAVVVLVSFLDSMEKFRGRTDWIYGKFFDETERSILRLREPKTLMNTKGFCPHRALCAPAPEV
jgi:hypothetical protein